MLIVVLDLLLNTMVFGTIASSLCMVAHCCQSEIKNEIDFLMLHLLHKFYEFDFELYYKFKGTLMQII